MPRAAIQQAALNAHFMKADPILYEVVQQVGPFRVNLERNRFRMLVSSIISQQLSTAAAKTIRMRLEAMIGPDLVTAEALSRLPKDDLRSAGLSNQKAGFISDLAAKVLDGTIKLSTIARKSDEAVIDELTKVRGIGKWTAQMFLMFSLGRLDVFPHDDLGVRTAIRNLYQLPELPDKSSSLKIADKWKPYATIGSWYCWRSLDLAKELKRKTAELPSQALNDNLPLPIRYSRESPFLKSQKG